MLLSRLLRLQLRLRPLHLRLRPLWPLSRRRHYSRLALRSPILGLPALLLLRGCRQRSERLLSLGVPDLWRLGTWHLHLSPLLTLSFNLLLRRRVPLLLVRNHLLPGSLSLHLLLLTQGISLTLLLLHLFAYAFALRLLSADAICALLLNLLPAQILHLLPRVSITASCLSGQIRNLSFSCLLRRKVLLLACPRRAFALRWYRGCSAFISDLNLLIPDPVG